MGASPVLRRPNTLNKIAAYLLTNHGAGQREKFFLKLSICGKGIRRFPPGFLRPEEKSLLSGFERLPPRTSWRGSPLQNEHPPRRSLWKATRAEPCRKVEGVVLDVDPPPRPERPPPPKRRYYIILGLFGISGWAKAQRAGRTKGPDTDTADKKSREAVFSFHFQNPVYCRLCPPACSIGFEIEVEHLPLMPQGRDPLGFGSVGKERLNPGKPLFGH